MKSFTQSSSVQSRGLLESSSVRVQSIIRLKIGWTVWKSTGVRLDLPCVVSYTESHLPLYPKNKSRQKQGPWFTKYGVTDDSIPCNMTTGRCTIDKLTDWNLEWHTPIMSCSVKISISQNGNSPWASLIWHITFLTKIIFQKQYIFKYFTSTRYNS